MKWWCFLLAVLLPLALPAQPGTKVLQGYLGVEGGESFTYKLVFTDSAGFISGLAYTWLYEGKEVVAEIQGKIDNGHKTLSFKETKIIANKGFQSNTTICLIDAVLGYKEVNGHLVFSGPITSSDVSNAYCGRGTISIRDTEVLRSLFSPVPPVPEEPLPAAKPPVIAKPTKPLRVVYDTARTRTVSYSPPTPEKITSGKEKSYEWHTDSLVLELWDNSMIDGDVVSVFYNGAVVLDNYSLVRTKKTLLIPLAGETSTLKIKAINEGTQPPNTADIVLWDGTIKYLIFAYNDVGKESVIHIKKKQ